MPESTSIVGYIGYAAIYRPAAGRAHNVQITIVTRPARDWAQHSMCRRLPL